MLNLWQIFQSKGKYVINTIINAILNNEPNKITDLEREWHDSYHEMVSFHLKRQPKEVRDHGFDAKYKSGQGISAWSKLLNVVFSSMTRWYSRFIPDVICDNIQLSFGKSDRELSEKFQDHAKHLNDKNYVKLMADFSEFDSSQEKQGILATCNILKMLGVNHPIVTGKHQTLKNLP